MRKIVPNHFDAIVLGVGGMGSATCYYLAQRGIRVLGLERFNIPHDMGSSHGLTRIIRLAYYEHPSYVNLLRRSYELWRDIQGKAGEQLLYITGSIDAGPPGSWVFEGSWRSAREHNLEHEILTGAEMRRRFPGYNLPPETLALLQPEGGFLLPERCVVNYVLAAQAHGAEIHACEQVLGWEPHHGGVKVTTTQDSYTADKLVITAGAWAEKFVPELRGMAVPERQVLAWLACEQPELFHHTRFPVFNLLVEEGRYYGFPQFSVPGFKFGRYHHFEEVVDAEDWERDARPEDERILREFAHRYFPKGAGPTMALKSCMFTNTPDRHFIIDLHPEFPQVVIASPCSGHGFKFASVVGEICADLAEKAQTRHDLTLFRLRRFTDPGYRQAHGIEELQTGHSSHPSGRGPVVPRAATGDVAPFWSPPTREDEPPYRPGAASRRPRL